MRNIVLDTNILVSAGIKKHGIPNRLVEDWVLSGRVNLLACPYIIDEYLDVLKRSKFAQYGFPPIWLEELIVRSIRFPDPPPWPLPLPDATDAPFLALAHAANAWLITGNLKHFPESTRQGATVLSPAEYLAYLTAT